MRLSKRWLNIAAACGLFATGACFTPIPAIAQTAVPGTARVWFYRDGSPSDGVGVTTVRLNGNPVGESDVNSSFYRDVPAGQYHVSLDNPVTDLNQSADISLVPGQVAYIKIATLDNWDTSSGGQRGGGAHTTFYIWPMPPAVGSAAVARLPLYGG